MFAQTFYHKTLRKYVTYFGTLFNDIYISRVSSSNSVLQTIKVPITYGPKDKALARVEADPNLNRPAAIILPVMAFEMTGLNYAGTRKLSTINKSHIKVRQGDDSRLQYVYNPVPYDIDFSLYIMVKNAEDGTRILEQILPYFTPEWTATLNLIPELDVKMDIPVIIKSTTLSDNYDSSYEERRVLTWTIDFTMQGYLYGPIKKTGIIKLANTNFYESLTANDYSEKVTIYPGMLANGSPTTDPSLTVPYTQINESDDWDYIIVRESIDDK